MGINTGLGTTGVFTIQSLSLKIVSMDIGNQTLPTVNVSTLATTSYEQYIPGDLSESGQVTFECQFDSEADQIVLGVVDTLTITLPLAGTGATNATWVGTGFITDYKPPGFVKNELQTHTITFQFDGGANSGTAPTFTKQTT